MSMKTSVAALARGPSRVGAGLSVTVTAWREEGPPSPHRGLLTRRAASFGALTPFLRTPSRFPGTIGQSRLPWGAAVADAVGDPSLLVTSS